MKDKIKSLDKGRLLIELDNKIYSIDAITRTTYKFTDKCYMRMESVADNITGVYFTAKIENSDNLEETINDFCNELIDQELRINVEKEFGNIRDAIVKKAFSSIDE